MFLRDKQRQSLDLPIAAVLRLEHAIAEVQVTLPGLASEPARAYLCAWQQKGGPHRGGARPENLPAPRLLPQRRRGDRSRGYRAGACRGTTVCRSLGFTLSDLDLRRRSPAEQQAIWSDLRFLQPAGAQPATPEVKPHPAVAGAGSAKLEDAPQLPAPEEMLRRRRQFIDNLGRLLAML